jgi:hypothetical protein
MCGGLCTKCAIGHRSLLICPVSLHAQVLSIASAYLGLQARLNYTDIWQNIPAHEGEPSLSAEV